MASESILDVPYSLNPGISISIRSTTSIVILGVASPLELPLAFIHVLVAFAETKTAREAFQCVGVEIDIGEFGEIVKEFGRLGLLRREVPVDDVRGLQQLLNPGLFADAALFENVSSGLKQGHPLIITDALPLELAEAAYRELCESTAWSVAEGGHDFFHYRASMINQLKGNGPALQECNDIFSSRATRHFVGTVSGRDCDGQTNVAAAWYRPNDYALPHEDSAAANARSVAFVWYLTKGWQREWGGSLFWCPTGQYIVPKFNTLLMFNVTPSNMHFVCPVAPIATARRLTINGFWTRSERKPRPVQPSSEGFISPPSYGSPAAASCVAPAILL